MFLDTVLNAACTAATAKLDAVSLHTDDPGINGANEDEDAGRETLTWVAPASGNSSASASWTDIEGSWTHVGFWDSSTFVGSMPLRPDEGAVEFTVAADLDISFRHRVDDA